MTAAESVPEVRDEWVEAAKRAWVIAHSADAQYPGGPIAAALAAVVPLIEADVGDRIAAEIRLVRKNVDSDGPYWSGYRDGLQGAANIAQTARTARAVATGDEGGQR